MGRATGTAVGTSPWEHGIYKTAKEVTVTSQDFLQIPTLHRMTHARVSALQQGRPVGMGHVGQSPPVGRMTTGVEQGGRVGGGVAEGTNIC